MFKPLSRTVRHRLAVGSAALLVTAAAAAPAPGQPRRAADDVLEPPSMGNITRSDSVLPRLGMAFVIVIAVIGVNLIPSKRGHQD